MYSILLVAWYVLTDNFELIGRYSNAITLILYFFALIRALYTFQAAIEPVHPALWRHCLESLELPRHIKGEVTVLG